MNNKEIALQYLAHGLSVIPLSSPSMISKKLPPEEFILKCKKPLVSWKEYQFRLPTENEVKEWFNREPLANIGIITGKISNLVVFDLDSEGAIIWARHQGGFPDSVKATTGRGCHIYMKYPDFDVVNSVNKDLKMDIRADGGFVVAPPSEHGSGKKYVWVEGYSIFDRELADHVPWTRDYLKEYGTKTNQPKKESHPKPLKTVSGTQPEATLDQYAAILQNGAQQGNRNDSATKLIGHLLGKGNDEVVVWEMVKQWNQSKNNPPLGGNELRKIFDSIRDLHSKNSKKETEKKETEKKEIDVTKFLDNESKVSADYNEQYVRIPFAAGDLLANMQEKMNGGLMGGRTYILGGIPTAGKTVLLNNIADNVCLNGHPVIFFSYDDGVTELRYRSYSRFSGSDIEQFNNRELSSQNVMTIFQNDNVAAISKMKYVVQEMIKIEDWPQIVQKIYARHQKAPVLIVDYLRKVKIGSNRFDERLRVDEIMSALTNIAKQYNLPVIAISELSRESYKSGQRLNMSSFKESGNIEYEASWLGILAAVEDDGNGEFCLKENLNHLINQNGNIDLVVFKAKRGTGTTGKISLKLDKSHMSVRDRIEGTKSSNGHQQKRSSKFD